ncbi:unnamed protein product [Sphagnum jensenii]|uniref:acid phosphatase n=1 Tax=Sphagnum jensenii TaxID=128206 RepID=A0ABP1AMF3_9BRYO
MASWEPRPLRDEEIGLLSALQVPVRDSGSRRRFCLAKTVGAMLVGFCLGCVVASWYATNENMVAAGPLYPPPSLFPLNFLVVGDWGRRGRYNQTLVAAQMGRVGQDLNIDFVISAGDNFYQHGLIGPEDQKFSDSFTDIYTAPSLQKTWYTVLGNHDYMGDVLALLGDFLPQRDWRWFCHRQFQIQCPLCGPSYIGECEKFVEFFFIDTTPFVDEYWNSTGKETFDWRGLAPREEQLWSQLQNLSSALEQSAATWKIVVGHHTIRSLGHHGDTLELVQQVLPILEAQNVDLYINGHDHCLEYIKHSDSDVHFITSGGGSKAWQGMQTPTEEDGLQFGYDGQGFVSVSMTVASLHLQFHDALGSTRYSLDLKKH